MSFQTSGFYTCTAFKGHYPVGAAAIVAGARSQTHAATLLEEELARIGLKQSINPESMRPMNPGATILCDGNY